MADQINRRRFLKVLGVTGGGAAVLSGCSGDAAEKLVPYLVPPEYEIPGIPTYYATTCRECPAGCGLHVKVNQGRATKLEGNPDHPVNRGKLCSRAQATLQGTYNPDRIQSPLSRTAQGTFEPVTWEEALTQVAQRLGNTSGDRVWFLSGIERGSFDTLLEEWLAALGSTNRVVYEPFGFEAISTANQQVFGTSQIPGYDFARARVVVSFGADFLDTWLSPVEYTRGFSESHAYRDGQMGKLVVVDPRMGLTGISADEWVAPQPGSEALIALAMAQVILSQGLSRRLPTDARRLQSYLDAYTPETVTERCGVPAPTIARLAREFAARESLAVAGGVGAQHNRAHVSAAAANMLNYVAGNVGETVRFYREPNPARSPSYARLVELTEAMRGGRVGMLFMHGTNPTFATPSGLDFGGALESAEFKVSFSRFMDETAVQADLILPDHDPLEQWNDYEPQAGRRLLQQPVMQPVFDTRQTGDVILDLAQRVGGNLGARFSTTSYKEYLQARWGGIQRSQGDRRPFNDFWLEALQQGGVWQEPATLPVRLERQATNLTVETWRGSSDLVMIAFPSSSLYDGRFANRPWLQELPDPVTKITWGSWVELSPATAERLGVVEGDVIEVRTEAGVFSAPVYVHPGIRDGVLAVPLGQGHAQLGRYAEGRGVNVFRYLSRDPTEFGGLEYYLEVTAAATGEHVRLAKTEGRRTQMDRGIAQSTTLAAAAAGHIEPHETEHAAHVPHHIEPLLERVEEMQHEETERGNYEGEQPRWALSVDLSKCTGCSACVVACNSENNIPYVGEERVKMGRELQWMRVERYFDVAEDGSVEVDVVPMMCQQCGNAPCEPVCPVFAAYHTPDGLNGQVYNRCVGTRYCSNNCPYKVRYFNWFDFQDPKDETFAWPEPFNWMLNPDVTIRSKGVMEKCTFCVQRIRGAQHQAAMEDRDLRDGEILTACQQTCPADAIVFGDLHDPDSEVASQSGDERGYHVLGSLNTKPGVTYLMRVRNGTEA